MEKILCLAAYVLSLPGALIARFAGSKSRLCLLHARRSVELFLFTLFVFVCWAALSYALAYIPYVGFPVAMGLFALVAAEIVFCFVLAVMGIVAALRGREMTFPLVSSFMRKAGPLFKALGLEED